MTPFKNTNHSIQTSLAGLLFALTGVLIATSFFNTASSGIPVFYATILIPIISGIRPRPIFLAAKARGPELWIYFMVATEVIALISVTLIQTIWFSLSSDSQIIHVAARIMFLAYFAICVRYVRDGIAWNTMLWLRRLLIAAFFYGVYQVPAKLLGLPLFLDWLRNNKSYMNYGYDAAGWTSMIRSTAIFAEPSQATIPMVVAILLNLYLPLKRTSRRIGWLSIFLFTLTSASRSMWLTTAGLIVGYMLSRVKRLGPWLSSRRLIPITLLLITYTLVPAWALIGSQTRDADLSQQERAGGIVLGIFMIRDSPLIGFGWNSASVLSDNYLRTAGLPNAMNIEGGFIQNMLVSYWQQAGLPGVILALLPFVVVWRWSTASSGLKWGTLCAFLVAGGVGGDFGYLSLTWLWMALLVNVGTITDPRAKILQNNPTSQFILT